MQAHNATAACAARSFASTVRIVSSTFGCSLAWLRVSPGSCTRSYSCSLPSPWTHYHNHDTQHFSEAGGPAGVGARCERNTDARDHTVHISKMHRPRSMTPGSHSTHASEARWPWSLSPRQHCEVNVRDSALVSAPLRSRSMLPSGPGLQIRGSHHGFPQPVGATSRVNR